MHLSLLPRIVAESVLDLTPEFLHSRKIRLLMMDFDNTIVPYVTDEPTPQMLVWLEQMKQSDITLCVVSNSHRDRVKIFCKKYGITCITHAKKPFGKGIRQCLARFERKPEECALVGDQIFTDTLGANGTGVTSILVTAICNHTFWLKARGMLEIPFRKMAEGRRIPKSQEHGNKM